MWPRTETYFLPCTNEISQPIAAANAGELPRGVLGISGPAWLGSSLGIMRAFATTLTLVALTCFTGGCTRTYISTGDPGVPSPDGSTTRICWTIHGAYGRSYIEKTKKLVDVCIKRGQQPEPQILFLERYKFVASDLGGDAKWTSPDEVVVEFHDYGDGISSYDARKAGTVSNHLATLSFHLDKQSGKFIEKR